MDDSEKQDNLELGGNIELSGFRNVDPPSMVIIKKMIGNYARKMSDTCPGFERLQVTMKPVHSTEKSEKYEIHAKMLDNGNPTATEVTDRNLFMAVDSALKKIMNTIS